MRVAIANIAKIAPEPGTSGWGPKSQSPEHETPEQVRGLTADARSDIFAFGLVLYEMLSGRRAFARESAAETMTAIVREGSPLCRTSDSP